MSVCRTIEIRINAGNGVGYPLGAMEHVVGPEIKQSLWSIVVPARLEE